MSSAKQELTFEELLLINEITYKDKIEQLFEKYDREFSPDEEGGALVSMCATDVVFEQQVEDLFEVDKTSELSSSEGETEVNEVDIGMKMLHKMETVRNKDASKIADLIEKINKEINWDEERKYHMKKERQARRKRASTSSEEDILVSDLNRKKKKKRRLKKRRRLSPGAPRLNGSSAQPNSSYSLSNAGVEMGGGSINRSDIVLDSSYYDSDHYASPLSDYVCYPSEQGKEITLESSYYSSKEIVLESSYYSSKEIALESSYCDSKEIVLESSYYDSN